MPCDGGPPRDFVYILESSDGSFYLGSTTTTGARLDAANAGGQTAIQGKSSWIGVMGKFSSTSGSFPGVWGATDSLASGANGVRGIVNSITAGGELLLDCNDDDPVNPCGTVDYQSTVVVPVVSGNCYKIRIGGFKGGDSGTGTALIACEP